MPRLPDLSPLRRPPAGPLAGPQPPATPAPVTRFAPSPTGHLHLGHVVNALYVWGVARAVGGRVQLRIEDHDRIRCRPAYEASLLDDLAWLGLEPDEGLTPLVRQSDTPEAYAGALSRLRAAAHVYTCACSRREIGGGPYDGRCRDRGLTDADSRALRVVLPDAIERFDDLALGPQAQRPASQCGDLLIRDRDGHWTYQFAVTVDDLRHGVSLVIRGEDLLDSTGRQLALARLLGRVEPPLFLHHPLIADAAGRKLSKSAGDTGIRELRAAGHAPAAVLGLAAASVGLVPRGTHLDATSLGALFTPAFRAAGADLE